MRPAIMKKYLFIFVILFSACGVLRKSNDTITSNHSNDLAASTRSDNPLLYMQSDTLVPLSRYESDSADYIRHNFIENKHKYVCKDLNILLKDLEIPVKSYLLVPTPLNNDSIPYITLQFQTFKEVSRRMFNRETIRVETRRSIGTEEVILSVFKQYSKRFVTII
jgi:hypothetical protein